MSSDNNLEFENIDVGEVTEEDEVIILGSADDVSMSLEDDEYFDEEEENKYKKRSRVFWGALMFVNALLLVGIIYMSFFMFNPKERTFCNDNLFCGSNLSISSGELNKIVSSLESELGITIPDEYKDEYALLYAVKENDCLTDSEKQVFYSFIDIIKDNPYLDREAAYKSLRNVDVLYKCRPYTYDKNIQGVYAYKYESIGIFEKDEDNSILIHEGLHAIFCNEKTEGLPEYFKEGMTELLVNEYFSDKPFLELENYPLEIAGVKMLCEVTSPEVVLEAFSCGDMDIIAKDMSTITGDIEVAREALKYFEYAYLKNKGDLPDDKKDLSYEVIANKCIPVFRGIVSAKYEESDRRRVSYFYNEILVGNIFYPDTYDNYVDDLVEFGTDHKGYFSSKLKQQIADKEAIDKLSEKEKTLTK